MLRSYARVLLRGRSVTPPTLLATRRAGMQLRTRSGSAPSPKAGAVAPLDAGSSARSAMGKRPRAAAKATATKAIDVVKEEVREGEGVVPTAQRRSPRQRVKREQLTVAVKAERTVVKEEAAEEEEEEEDDDDGDEDDKDGMLKAAKKPRRVRVVKRGADGKPERWETVLEGIQKMRASQVADVDVAGVEVMFEEGRFEPHVTRFHVLISAMLSSQTKDPVNAAAMKRLIARGLSVSEMLAIDEKELAQLIHPVGFYNNKARYIKQVAQLLTDAAAEAGAAVVDIPDTFDALVALPGVGPKMAHLVMSCAWDNTVGICVDTHVHRISNRLGWVKTWNKANPKSQDPEKTRKELEEWLPREHWGPINVTLVGFGQTVCLPRGPKCGECAISHLCPSAFSSAI